MNLRNLVYISLQVLLLLAVSGEPAWAKKMSCVNGGVRLEIDTDRRQAHMSKVTNLNRYRSFKRTSISDLKVKVFSGQEQTTMQTQAGWRLEITFPKNQPSGWGFLFDQKTKRLLDLGGCKKGAAG